MFTDSEGRYITAGQWHDEKFYTFMAPEEEQAKAPAYLLLGGMKEDAEVTVTETGSALDFIKKTDVKVY